MIFGKILSSRSTTITLPSPITCIKKPPDSLTKFEKQKNYSSSPSLLLIKNRLKNIPSFSFNEVSLSEIEREINLINPRRATTSNGIPQNL